VRNRSWAGRPLALLVLLALVCVSAAPARAIGAVGPRPAVTAFARGSLKHPTLDSQLAALVARVHEGRIAPEVIARGARISRGHSVGVSIHVSGDPAQVAARLDGHGATVANVGDAVVEAYVPVTELAALGQAAGVLAVRALTPPLGRVVSQGVTLHGAPSWNASGYTGAGVKVGVIDLGFDGISGLVGSELPAPAARCYRFVGSYSADLADCDTDSVHGTAVAETLIDVAPGITLYVANPRSWRDLHETVAWMAAEGVAIINHSVGWAFEGPGDGTSPYTDGTLAAVDEAVAAGITWVNAAGNEGLSTWTGAAIDADADGVLEFTAGVERNGISVRAGATLYVQMRWDDSWTTAARDLDLYVVTGGGTVIGASEDAQTGQPGDEPFELLSFTPSLNGMLYLEVRQFGGVAPGWLQVQAFSGETLQYGSPSHSIAVPAESASGGLLAAGAASWATPETIESFSSQGPTRDGRVKPDIVGIDYADTVSYGPSGFPGTSQAAPHVAGLAALVKQRFPGLAPDAVADYLTQQASARGSVPNNTWGHGLAHLPAMQPGDNPVPVITRLSPSRVSIGTYPFSFTVEGAGFVPGSVVRWDGQERPTTYVSETTLTAEAQYLDTDYLHAVQITVVNPPPGGGVSNVVALTIDAGLATDHEAFERTWARTDRPVKELAVGRTWMWGDGPASDALLEEYAEAPGGQRSVKYYDKSRMEVTQPDADPAALWYVTNGLLVMELITGNMQVGDTRFAERAPAEVNVAGDPDDAAGPTYATFGALLDATPLPDGATISQRLACDGTVTDDPALAAYGVTTAERVQEPGLDHQIASVFWDFMNSSGLVYEDGVTFEARLFENPYYATGLPVTEAYWSTVKVAGEPRDVLIQCFERRCLTFTPANAAGWQVEAGNVGLHYFRWRYGTDPARP
jgi:subtilisin family serine protease